MATTRTLFGFHAVTARLRQHADSVKEIYVDSARHDARVRDLVARAKSAGIHVHAVNAERLASIAGSAANQGVVAVVDAQRPHVTLDDVFVYYTGRDLRDALQEPSAADSPFMIRR